MGERPDDHESATAHRPLPPALGRTLPELIAYLTAISGAHPGAELTNWSLRGDEWGGYELTFDVRVP